VKTQPVNVAIPLIVGWLRPHPEIVNAYVSGAQQKTPLSMLGGGQLPVLNMHSPGITWPPGLIVMMSPVTPAGWPVLSVTETAKGCAALPPGTGENPAGRLNASCVGTGDAQAPAWQTCPPAQAEPHWPQLATSD
jgi:hypothetical protein